MERSSFFNSVNGDRKYKASDFAEFFNSLLTNGVFPNPSTNLQVISNSNMTVTVKSGKAWINGYCYINDSDLILPIAVADGVLNRIDRIVLRMDTVGRAINAVVKKGTFASSPVAPELQRDADAYELGIADIYIAAGITSITQSNITDLRQDQNYCGIVDSLITPDTATLFNQFQDGFNTWFNGIKNTLGSDVAGNLLNKINSIAGTGRTTETVKKNADDIVALGKVVATHTEDMTYQIATGTATAIVISTGTLINGYAKTFIASANNNGSATTINGKSLYKPSTTTSPTLIAGKAYTVWYNLTGNCFFIKANAEGTSIASHVLAGKTFSNDNDTGLTGTMPNNAGATIGTLYPASGHLDVVPPVGYFNGATDHYVHIEDANFISANILNGKSIFGLAGTLIAGKRTASGSGNAYGTDINVSGLAFTPRIVIIRCGIAGTQLSYNGNQYTRYGDASWILPEIFDKRGVMLERDYAGSDKYYVGSSDYLTIKSDGFTASTNILNATYYYFACE